MIVIEALNHINIAAKDLEKSIEFYTVFLDFECIETKEDEAIITFDDQLKIRLVKSELRIIQKQDIKLCLESVSI